MSNENTRAITVSIGASLVLAITKLGVGLTMHSAGVLSEALHSMLDLVASGIAFIGIREASKPEDDKHPHGHGKMEDICAIVEGVLIAGAGAAIIYKSIDGLASGQRIAGLGVGMAVMFLSACLNLAVSFYLARVAKRTESVALAADAAHLKTDVVTSFGVFMGLALANATGITLFDTIAAIIVGGLVIRMGWQLIDGSLANVLDARLPEQEEAIIRGVLDGHSRLFYEFHNLRTRKSGNRRYIDLHLLVPSYVTVAEGHDIGHIVSGAIEDELPNSKVLIHLEPCKTRCHACPIGCGGKAADPAA